MSKRKTTIIELSKKMTTIRCPSHFTESKVSSFLEKMYEQIETENVHIDFNPIKFVYPYGTLLAALGIKNFVNQRIQNNLKTSAFGVESKGSAITYLKHFSFFQFIGINSGKKPGAGEGNQRYIPITVIKESELKEESKIIQETIERKSFQLSRIIFGKDSEIMKAEMLSYCIREVIRNVFEHSEATECIIMAQKWRNGYSEIAIADQGIGIHSTISSAHNVADVEDAIKLSLKPGISKETAADNPNDKWQNSGFGLYVISELGKRFGDFSISSNRLMIQQKDNFEAIEKVPIRGTIVKLKINTEDAEYFPNILNQIVSEGEAIAESVPGARKSASKSSKSTNN